jgi:hypothetical protein
MGKTKTNEEFDAAIDTEDAKAIAKAAFFTPLGRTFSEDGGRMMGLPLIFDSPPGGGKSSFWWNFAMTWLRRTNPFTGQPYLAYATITIGAQGEGRFGVVPVPVAMPSGQVVLSFPPPRDLIEAFPEKKGLLVWDDLSTMPPALSPVALDGLQRRRIGTHYLGDSVRCMGATNNVEDAAGGWDVAPAIVNRCGWLPFPDYDASQLGAHLQMGADANDNIESKSLEDEERRVMEAWGSAYARASQLVAGFLISHPTMVRRQVKRDEIGEARAAEPWASPRTIEMATRALASATVHNLTERQKDEFVASFVGRSWQRELAHYIVNCDLPRPEEVLDGLVEFVPTRTRLDRTQVVVQACVSLLTAASCDRRMERAKVWWKLAEKIAHEHADMIGTAIRSLYAVRQIVGMPEANTTMTLVHPVISKTRERAP